MVTNESYLRLRREVLELNETAAKYSLCKGICGGCCIRDLRTLPEDREIILEGIASGQISAATLERARRRATDPDVKRCPFLGDEAECTIYAHRPIVCIQHGNGGMPRDKATARRAIERPGNRTIKLGDIEKFSCHACAEHIDDRERIPLSIVGKSVAILLTIQDGQRHYGSKTMNAFLTEIAPEA